MTNNSIGVWLTEDGEIALPDPSNPYRYVGNDPIARVDPTGLYAEEPPGEGKRGPKPGEEPPGERKLTREQVLELMGCQLAPLAVPFVLARGPFGYADRVMNRLYPGLLQPKIIFALPKVVVPIIQGQDPTQLPPANPRLTPNPKPQPPGEGKPGPKRGQEPPGEGK